MSVNLLEDTFRLSIEFHTADTVIAEITDTCQEAKINDIITKGCLYVKEFESDELIEILRMREESGTNVSITDCSVWYYAKQLGCRLLTGDKKLKRCATEDGVMVSGILYITDMLVEENIVTKDTMADKLESLLIQNKRLPKKEIEKRIKSYRAEND